jgi:hypothetical protein
MSVERELDRLKFEASDERKKAVYSTTSKRAEREDRISVLQSSLEERSKARDQVTEKARRLLEMVRGDPRLGSSSVSEERLAAVLEANPAMRRVEAEMRAIQDELATLQREGLCRLVPRNSGVEADQHPLRTPPPGGGDAARQAAVSAAVAARRFLSDAELREVERLFAAVQGADGARIRRAAASLLRDFAQTILEAAAEPVSPGGRASRTGRTVREGHGDAGRGRRRRARGAAAAEMGGEWRRRAARSGDGRS